MELTDDQKDEIVKAAAVQIRERALKNATDSLAGITSSTAANVINEEVTKFVKEEVVPAVREALMQSKPMLVEAAIGAAGDMAMQLRAGMVKRLTDVLAKDWEAQELFKKMYGLR